MGKQILQILKIKDHDFSRVFFHSNLSSVVSGVVIYFNCYLLYFIFVQVKLFMLKWSTSLHLSKSKLKNKTF